MDSITSKLKSLAVSLGADLVGVTTKEILADGPPSADPSYLLQTANSVISFALSLDREKVRSFISKTKWRSHCLNRKSVVQKLYVIGDRIAEQLRSEGFEAVNVDINNNYRPEKKAKDVAAYSGDFGHLNRSKAARYRSEATLVFNKSQIICFESN